MNRNDKPNRSGGGGNATSARTSPSGTCTVGASGPTTLKSLADLLNQEAVTIVETAHGILARHTDTMHLPSVEALLALVPPSSQQSNKSTSALLLHDATATTAGGAPPSSRQQQQHHRATPIGSLLVASIDALAALLSKLGGSGGVAAALSDGSAASLTKLDVLAALLRVPLLFLLGDRQLPGGGGGGKQHGGGGSNRRSVPTAAASSASCAASSSSSQQSYVNMLVGATVALSTVGVFAVTTPRGAQGLSAGSVDHTARTAEQEVRALSLVLVAASAQGHPDLLSDCLPTLLPDVTSMEGLVNGSSPSNCKYPLLTPLMHDNVYRCRVAASTALTSILQKSQQRLALSAEPGPKDRQSFTSMSTGLGRMLRDVHAVVLCGLMNRETASVRALFLSVASGLVVVTPYNKCPHAQATMLKIIQLPFLADVLSTQKPPSDYSYACTFLGSVWRAKALQPAILGSTATTTPTQTTAPSAWGRPLGKGGSPSTPLTPAVSSLPPQIMPRLVSLVVAGLPALEALRALTHVARSYPTTYLTPAQTRTIIDLAEGLLVPQSKDENNNNNAATTATMTIQEMLRLLMHLCGLAWEPFQTPSGGGGNNNSSSSNGTTCGANSDAPNHTNDHDDDDAIHAATTHPVATATQEQRLRVLRFVYARAVRHTAAAVRMATYKCLGQIGDDVFAQVLLLPTTSTATGAWGSSDDGGSGKGQPQQKTTAPAAAVVVGTKAPSSSSYAYLVDDVIAAATNERDANVRAEALVTLGVWALRYHRSCGSSVERLSTFTDVALDRLQHDVDDEVRAKAVFVLSNVCAQQAGGVAALPSSTDDDEDAARLSHLRLKLCQAVGIAVHVANACRTKRGGFSGGQSVASVVAGHAVRMMQYLLKSLDATSLIMELPGHPEGIVSFFLEQLERYLHSPPVPQQPPFSGGGSVAAAAAAACWDVKTRWNAAYAMGEVLSNPTIYSADPPAARACFDMLMVAVVRDSNFKVRTRAVGAVEKVVAQLKAPRCTPPPPAAAPAPPINVGGGKAASGGDKKTQHVDCCAASASAETSQQGSEAERYQQAWTMQILAAYRTDWGTRLPSVLSTLCDVLSRLQEEEGAAQYREAGLLHTELMRAVQCVLDAAPGSSDFQDALAKHKRQLTEAGLL